MSHSDHVSAREEVAVPLGAGFDQMAVGASLPGSSIPGVMTRWLGSIQARGPD